MSYSMSGGAFSTLLLFLLSKASAQRLFDFELAKETPQLVELEHGAPGRRELALLQHEHVFFLFVQLELLAIADVVQLL